MTERELHHQAVKLSAKIDQDTAGLWDYIVNEYPEHGIPVLVALAGGEREHFDGLTDPQFAVFVRLAKLGLCVVSQGKMMPGEQLQ